MYTRDALWTKPESTGEFWLAEIRSWPGEVAVGADHPPGEQFRVAADQAGRQRLVPGPSWGRVG